LRQRFSINGKATLHFNFDAGEPPQKRPLLFENERQIIGKKTAEAVRTSYAQKPGFKTKMPQIARKQEHRKRIPLKKGLH